MAWVYILRGQSGRHYIGSTDNMERRIAEHQRGNNHTTRRLGGSVELVATARVSSMDRSAGFGNTIEEEKESASRDFDIAVAFVEIRAAPKAFGVGFRVRIPADPIFSKCFAVQR
jgi:predicted GIY-YIG superfamily endonuclease